MFKILISTERKKTPPFIQYHEFSKLCDRKLKKKKTKQKGGKKTISEENLKKSQK